MITPWQMYWITRCSNIQAALGIMLAVSLLLAIVSIAKAIHYSSESRVDPDNPISKQEGILAKSYRSLAIGFGSASLVLLTAITFIPGTREMAAIIVIPKIANSETVQEVGTGIKELAIEWLKELKPQTKGEAE